MRSWCGNGASDTSATDTRPSPGDESPAGSANLAWNRVVCNGAHTLVPAADVAAGDDSLRNCLLIAQRAGTRLWSPEHTTKYSQPEKEHS
ncbi:hypothetical protein EDF60_2913 [Leucobacter luti]|nr:hypothetical protein [Leucobacter luti]TCK35534.1 hypothetical protein EDF60_2913 [Leucobacter luti]